CRKSRSTRVIPPTKREHSAASGPKTMAACRAFSSGRLTMEAVRPVNTVIETQLVELHLTAAFRFASAQRRYWWQAEYLTGGFLRVHPANEKPCGHIRDNNQARTACGDCWFVVPRSRASPAGKSSRAAAHTIARNHRR